jgi:hypothetical protein
LQVNINDILQEINRETKDIMQGFGDFGGLLTGIELLFSGFFMFLSKNKIFALITNRFFSWYEEENEVQAANTPAKKQQQVAIPIPSYLEFHSMMQ